MSLFESLENRQHFAFGTILTAYGTGGSSSAPTIGGSDSGYAEALTVSGGKTLVGVGGGLTRFNADGSLDISFGTNGITGFRGTSFRDDAVDASGRIYVLSVGTSGTLLQRYTAAGKLDSTWGTNGTALVESSNKLGAVAIDVQADGKVVVAGSMIVDGVGTITRIYRLTTAAVKDNAFGSGGVAEFKLGYNDLISPIVGDHVVDVRVLGSGKIELLGSSFNYSGTDEGNSFVALARLTSGGTLDTTFATGGIARRATFDDDSLAAYTGVIRPDGSAVVSMASDIGVTRNAFVGFSGSGKTIFTTYVPSNKFADGTSDATALSDGRTAFFGDGGAVFTITPTGVVSNSVTPILGVEAYNGIHSKALVANASGDLILADVNSPYVRVTDIDAGKLNDARPDNLPASGALDTAVDAFGGLHVAFFDSKTKNLKYAYRNPQGYWGGIRTVDATVGAGAAISIDTYNNKGRTNVAIAYYDASAADLRLATSNTNGRRFGLTTVASRGYVGTSPSLHFTDNGGYAVSYYSKSTKSLYYALNTGRGFVTELVDSKGSGEWNELQFDPATRRPAIAYSSSGKTVKYALKDKVAGWANPTVVATTAAGAGFVNLAIPYDVASYGGPKISYYDLASADLVIATFDRYAAKAKRWSTHIIASRGVLGAYNDIISPYSTPTLYAYTRSGDGVFRYDYDPAGQTATATVAVLGGGRNLSLAVDGNNNVVASAYLDTASGQTFVR